MHKNQLFRELECGFSVETTAKLCFKSVSTVKRWDRGNPIPPECIRLMRLVSGRELSPNEAWRGFRMNRFKLELPNGQLVSPQELAVAQAILEIGGEKEHYISRRLLKYSRMLYVIRNASKVT
ncbi:regulator [Vibrio coralliilyticus]|nr:regulator [Vibrio coralliilyticus]NOI32230.1 regulator [Vibrio coralliilyticus]NOI51365.1 regulator [Vibrio coralliilyticus]